MIENNGTKKDKQQVSWIQNTIALINPIQL